MKHEALRSGAVALAIALVGAAAQAGEPTLNQRVTAATQTAHQHPNCAAIAPFYWEVGGAQSRIAGDSVIAISDTTVYDANTVLNIASASKWLYAAYVLQRQGTLTTAGIDFLTFRSGYTNFDTCLPWQTVDSCLSYRTNGQRSADTIGKFDYNGGHMEKHASLIGLGPLDNAGLASEIRSQLGSDINLSYSQPQLPGGVVTTANDYARFLRKILAGSLTMSRNLGAYAVCTNRTTCPNAVYSPVPLNWHYSLGHWVEDDLAAGDDGSFSSAGAFGFYPWIDRSKSWYGIVARQAEKGTGLESQECGKEIRKAWMTGVVQQ